MKKILLIILLSCIKLYLFGQDNLSSQTKMFVKDVDKYQKTKSIIDIQKKYPITVINQQYYIGALMQVENINESELKKIGILVNSKNNDIWSIKIPIEKINALTKVAGIKYLQVDKKIKKKLNEARDETYVSLIHAGWELPRPYFGENVVIGICDGGFDFNHPTFFDTLGNLRIVRVWDQEAETGNPPTGFSYGAEYSDETAILNAGDAGNGSHGTHVAGIAAGSGIGSSGNYTGVAPNAEIVIINNVDGESSLTDAINYIFNYANSVGKPAVINMSLGSHIGPHDGTSIQDQAFNSLIGAGKILVGAAGNEGGTALHLSHQFTGDTIQTIINFEDSEDKTGYIDLWGSAGNSFTVAVNILNNSGAYIDYTDYISSTNPELEQNFIYGADTIKIEITGETNNPNNNKPNITVWIENQSTYNISLEITSSNSLVHIWNHGLGNGAALVDTLLSGNTPPFPVLVGNTDYTVGEIGGTATSVITVGAYTTKNQFTNVMGNIINKNDNGVLNEIANFSSRGPTSDSRIKPDITAPGNVIVSSVNSYDNAYLPSGECWEDVVSYTIFGGDTFYYGSMEGTSMATPFMTGVIALMLEVNPNLTISQIKSIFEQTAREDSYTGTIPSGGSNTWGYGKIDAYDALDAVILAIKENNNYKNKMFLYPNPCNDNINLIGANIKSITLYNAFGQNIFNQYYNSVNTAVVDIKNIAEGIYFIEINSDKEKIVQKIMVKH